MPDESALPHKSDPKANRFLATLQPEDYDALMAVARIVPMKFRKRIMRQDEPVDAVYFPLTCMFSLFITSGEKPLMALATIGNEGVFGAVEVFQKQGSMGMALIQLAGDAVRVEAAAFLKTAGDRPPIQRLIYQDLYVLLRKILFNAACHRLHSMEARCARWLLMTQDRAAQDTFPLTQEFMSHTLGVRRATVNVAIGTLKKAGFIHYVRGHITVSDRRGLESVACDCYQAVNNLYLSSFASLHEAKPPRASPLSRGSSAPK